MKTAFTPCVFCGLGVVGWVLCVAFGALDHLDYARHAAPDGSAVEALARAQNFCRDNACLFESSLSCARFNELQQALWDRSDLIAQQCSARCQAGASNCSVSAEAACLRQCPDLWLSAFEAQQPAPADRDARLVRGILVLLAGFVWAALCGLCMCCSLPWG